MDEVTHLLRSVFTSALGANDNPTGGATSLAVVLTGSVTVNVFAPSPAPSKQGAKPNCSRCERRESTVRPKPFGCRDQSVNGLGG